eukprot:scaffold7618_cov90-Alexandrium_tamarense.AAC.1
MKIPNSRIGSTVVDLGTRSTISVERGGCLGERLRKREVLGADPGGFKPRTTVIMGRPLKWDALLRARYTTQNQPGSAA